MQNSIDVNNISLKPATPDDKRKVFEWLTNSDLTKEMIGPPKYPDAKIPKWEKFNIDYADYYFDGSNPIHGQCFIIKLYENEIGQINHNNIDLVNKIADLDIWLCDSKYTGKGFGTEAIKLMCDYLFERYSCETIILSPSKRNKNAIRAYEKVGFVITDMELDESSKDYCDNVVLIKRM